MYELRLERKMTKSMFSNCDKETKDWVVNAIASLVIVDNVVETHELVALQEAVELLDSRNEIQNLINMVRDKELFEIKNLKTTMKMAGEIFFYLAAIACIDGKMKKVEFDLLKQLGGKLCLPQDFQREVIKWSLSQMKHNQFWSQEQSSLNQHRKRMLEALHK